MSSAIVHIRNHQIQNPKVVRQIFDDLTDGRYLVEVSRKNKRTLPQNAYLHAVLIPEFKNALNSVGYDEVRTYEQAKSILKETFLKSHVVNEATGEALEFTKDTHTLSKVEMMELIEEVIKFCADKMNYQIPFPNEQAKLWQ